MPSSVVRSYHYDSVKQTLTIVYVSGVVYQYLDVPQHIYEYFVHSGSKGRYLNLHIKKNYTFKKVE